MKTNKSNGVEELENCGWKITQVIGSSRNNKADYIIEQRQHLPLGDILSAVTLKEVIEHITRLVMPVQFCCTQTLENQTRRLYKFKSAGEAEQFADLFNGQEYLGKTVEGNFIVSI